MAPPLSSRPVFRPVRLALGAILALTLWRVLWLPLDARDLFVDDAQYWLWGQEPAWGYYSKPPLIGWLIGLSTALGGDGAFWVRLPLPLLHAGTALVVMALGARLWDARTGALAGVLYASLPLVGVGSLLASADTPLLFFVALAALLQLRLAARPSAVRALLWGAAIGAGMLAKYAMLFVLPGLALAAVLLPQARLRPRDAALGGIAALAVLAPNLWWNAQNGFVTLTHTAYNADWGQAGGLRWADLTGFLGAQFAAGGPVLFAAWALALPRARRFPGAYAALLSAPVLLIVSGQALWAGANANWAAAAYPGVALLGAAALVHRPLWRRAALGINIGLCLALPLAAALADRLRTPSGDLLLARWMGRSAVSLHAAEVAQAQGLGTIVAARRDLLADLFHTLRGAPFAIAAEPLPGPPAHYYAQRHALTPGDGSDVLYLTDSSADPACREGAPGWTLIEAWPAPEGAHEGQTFRALRVPRACWFRDPGP
nr:glycosyltransferase family 39 protein [Rubellimicrobium thermophilum]